MADVEAQCEDQRTYRSVGTAPQVSMFKLESVKDPELVESQAPGNVYVCFT